MYYNKLDRLKRKQKPLTRRELQVIELTAKGFTYGGMADYLGVTESTMKFHMMNAMSKLDAHNGAHMVSIAYQVGLLSKNGTLAVELPVYAA